MCYIWHLYSCIFMYLKLQFTAVCPLTWLLLKISSSWNWKHALFLHLIFKTWHLSSSFCLYLLILCMSNWPEDIFQLRKLKYCKINVFAKKCHPVTGTLLKTAHWIFKISYLLFQIIAIVQGGAFVQLYQEMTLWYKILFLKDQWVYQGNKLL